MIEPATGVLLISDPFLRDPNFARTVVLLCEHNPDGTFGLILNRGFHQTLGELVTELDGCDLPVFFGGPVQPDTLHFLHQLPDEIPGGQVITDGVYWGGNFETVTRLLQNGELDTNRIRFYLGYSGWSSGQLDGEMTEKTWLTVKANPQLIFHPQPETTWKAALETMGGEYRQLAHYPIDPQLN